MSEPTQVLTIQDMINATRNDSPSGFDQAFNDVIGARIADALQAKRDEVAQNLLGATPEAEQEEEQESDATENEASTDEDNQPEEQEDQDEDTETDTGSADETRD